MVLARALGVLTGRSVIKERVGAGGLAELGVCRGWREGSKFDFECTCSAKVRLQIKVKHGLVSQACFWPRSLQCCYSETNDNKMIVGTAPSKVGPQNMFPSTK